MNRSLAHLLVCLSPRSWRARYGTEFEPFLAAGHTVDYLPAAGRKALERHGGVLITQFMNRDLSRVQARVNHYRFSDEGALLRVPIAIGALRTPDAVRIGGRRQIGERTSIERTGAPAVELVLSSESVASSTASGGAS